MAACHWLMANFGPRAFQRVASLFVGPQLAAARDWSDPLTTLPVLGCSSTQDGLREEGRICTLQMLQKLGFAGEHVSSQDVQIPRVSST